MYIQGWEEGEPALPVRLVGVVGEVVGKGDDEAEPGSAGLCNDGVQPAERPLVVDARRGLQVEPLEHGEAEHAHDGQVLPGCAGHTGEHAQGGEGTVL